MKYITFTTFLLFGLLGVYYLATSNSTEEPINQPEPKGELVATFALIADSHIDHTRLKKAVEKAQLAGVSYIVHFGDLSDFGGLGNLQETKRVLDSSEIDYLVIPGDRDVVEGGENFENVFKEKICGAQLLQKYSILCFSNPYNYTLLPDFYTEEFYSNLQTANVIFSSQPIYNHKSNIYMGFYDAKVKKQADQVFEEILQSNANYLVSADAHFFIKYQGPADSKLTLYTLGALTDKRNLQTPNFALMKIYQGGQVELEQVLVE